MAAANKDHTLLPPGPVEKFDLNSTPESFIRVAEYISEFGDICRIQSLSRNSDSYLINQADYLSHILVKNHQNYSKGVGFDRVKMLLGNGIIVSDGPFWRRQRRMMQPAFTRKVIAKLSHQIECSNQILYADWQKKALNEEIINISKIASDLSLDIILRALISEDLDSLIETHGANPFSFLTEDTTRDIKLVLKFREVAKLLLEIIQFRHDKKPSRIDFLAMFMDSRDKETGQAMTNKELMDELMTMIIAGHETSAITLNWVWYFIATHPEVEQNVHKEVDAKVTKGKTPTFEDVANLSYIKQLVDETLRYYPPVWIFSRKAIEDDQLGDYFVPAGTDIFISPYYLHRHTGYWHSPEIFDPQRFIETAIAKQHKQAYIPFSAGPRRCIGDFFASIEMQMHIGLMASSFQLQIIPEQKIELEPEINLRSKNPILMKITNRK